MRKVHRLATPVLLALCVITAGAAEDTLSREDLVREFYRTVPADTTTNARVIDINDFHIESSRNKELDGNLKTDGNDFQMVYVSAKGVFKVGVEKGRPMSAGGGVAIFHRDSGEPILAVSDSNGDGQLDLLTYSKLDSTGKVVLSVTDYEADGQPDFRANFAEHYSEIWHMDRWYRIENRSGHRGIVLDGRFVELRHEKNRYSVP